LLPDEYNAEIQRKGRKERAWLKSWRDDLSLEADETS